MKASRQSIAAAVVLMSVAGTAWLLSTAATLTIASRDQTREAAPRPIQGGFFEASGVVAVGKTPAVLIVDDSHPAHVVWMELDAAGAQRGPAVLLPLGAHVIDPEDITTDGTSYYVVGSQSQGGAGGDGLVQFDFDANRRQIGRVSTLKGLGEFLVSRVPELARGGGRSRAGALNIEGLTWDADRRRLLLGLRSPLVGRDAAIVPLAFRDPQRPLAVENLVVEPLIRIPLDGSGVRGLGYDSAARDVLMISGAPDYGPGRPFELLTWDGRSAAIGRHLRTFNQALKPEGVTEITVGGRKRILVVFDTGLYEVID